MKLPIDPSTGMPLLRAQRAIGLSRLVNEDGSLVTETIVLPNLVLFFQRDPNTGTRLGDHQMVSPDFAGAFVVALTEYAAHVETCEAPGHVNRSMAMLDPEQEFA